MFTNRTGSNFTRGIAAALLGEVTIKGELNTDIAVLELDEAHAVHFVDKIQPKYNSIAVFKVGPVSFHEVQEVIGKKNRLALTGWLYGRN